MQVVPEADTAVSMLLTVAPTDGHIQKDIRADQFVRLGDQHAAQRFDLRAQRAHALDRLIDRARADIAAARQRNLRTTGTAPSSTGAR